MSENPLLPNAQLQALHALLVEAGDQQKRNRGKKKGKSSSATLPTVLGNQEALLAGTVLQLAEGDILVSWAGEPAASRLSEARRHATGNPPATLDLAPGAPQLALANGLANALRQTGSDRLVFTLLSATDAPTDWAATLAAAQEGKHPLVIACADASGADTFRPGAPAEAKAKSAPWTWAAVQRTSARLKLPILSVDGEDAVAVYRVMQESVLRARSGGGPAILWAMLPSAAEAAEGRPKANMPLRRLERYLRARSIEF